MADSSMGHSLNCKVCSTEPTLANTRAHSQLAFGAQCRSSPVDSARHTGALTRNKLTTKYLQPTNKCLHWLSRKTTAAPASLTATTHLSLLLSACWVGWLLCCCDTASNRCCLCNVKEAELRNSLAGELASRGCDGCVLACLLACQLADLCVSPFGYQSEQAGAENVEVLRCNQSSSKPRQCFCVACLSQ